MVCRHIEGFEAMDEDIMDSIPANAGTLSRGQPTRGAWSAQSLHLGGTSDAAQILQQDCPSGNTVWLGIGYIAHGSVGGGSGFVSFFNGTALAIIRLNINGGGFLTIMDSNGTTVATATTHPVSPEAWHYYELQFVTGSASSVVKAWIDDDLVIDTTGVDCLPVSGGGDSHIIYYDVVGSLAALCEVDDVMVNDSSGTVNNGRTGDIGVQGLRPNAAGDLTQLRRNTSVASFDTEVAADAPYAFYRMDETAGTQTTDASGNVRHGTYSGGFTLNQVPSAVVNDPLGIRAADTYIVLNGTTGESKMPNGVIDTASATAALTVIIWGKFPASLAAVGIDFPLVGGDHSTQVNQRLSLYLHVSTIGGASTLQLNLQDNNAIAFTMTGKADASERFKDDRWHCYAFTLNAAKEGALYMDGELLASGTHVFTAGMTFDLPYIGRDPNLGNQKFWPGNLNECIVYHTALSAERIRVLYGAAWANYQLVDDGDGGSFRHQSMTPGSTSYNPLLVATDYDFREVDDVTVNDIDLYNFTSIDTDLTKVAAVAIQVKARKSDPGTAAGATVMKTSGTVFAGSDFSLTTGYRWYTTIYDQDPSGTPNPWGSGDIAALQAGFKVR